jgi:hypothetical protein
MGDLGTGTIDRAYKPRTCRGCVRYTGFNQLPDQGATSAIVDAAMQRGNLGKLHVISADAGGGPELDDFTCRPAK